jgi:hypothetical protein
VFTIDNEDSTYELTDGINNRVVHYNRLEKYHPRDPDNITLGVFPTYINNEAISAPIEMLTTLSAQGSLNFDLALSVKLAAKRRAAAPITLLMPSEAQYGVLATPILDRGVTEDDVLLDVNNQLLRQNNGELSSNASSVVDFGDDPVLTSPLVLDQLDVNFMNNPYYNAAATNVNASFIN